MTNSLRKWQLCNCVKILFDFILIAEQGSCNDDYFFSTLFASSLPSHNIARIMQSPVLRNH